MRRAYVCTTLLAAALGVAGCSGDTATNCSSGSRQDCTLSDGKTGEQTCSNGAWGVCQPKVVPCTDNAQLPCTQSDGKAGVQICKSGAWTACGPIPGSCTDDTYKKCTLPDGKDGVQKCVSGQWAECKSEVVPKCKEGEKQACKTACGSGTEVCVNADWANCDAPKPQQETCDGIDNNCDGQTDEVCSCVHGKTEACYSGSTTTRGKGQCKDGTRVCNKGTWGQCEGEVLPAAKEDCTDQIDNDCDGTVNNGCACPLGTTQACGSDVGTCKKGTQSCLNQGGVVQWGPCTGGVEPAVEKLTGCDGKDNDCDGVIDNGLDGDALEVNDTCAQARPYTISELDSAPLELKGLTLYPKGDVDFFKITAQETAKITIPPCIPWPFKNPGDPQCNYLDVEIVAPVVTGLTYEYSIYTYDPSKICGTPLKTFTSTGKKTIQWAGECGVNDSMDFWIKVAPKSTSTVTWSCLTYSIKFRFTQAQAACL
jgi:hypothetical protein